MTQTLAEKREARALATPDTRADMLERVLIQGDLSKLSAEQRIGYVQELCARTGLDPFTQPFEYLVLQGKTVLYAKKACTDQLRSLHKISVVDMDQEEREGVFSVTVKVANGDGRTDMDIGSVKIAGLQGDARANAMMKASTKAKRRATLSICGLGMLDETEVETIPAARLSPQAHDAQHAGEDANPPSSPAPRRSNVIVNPATGKKIDTENARNQRPEWSKFTDGVQGYIDARDADGLKAWFAGPKIAEYVAGWVFKDEAHEHFEKALDEIARRIELGHINYSDAGDDATGAP